MKHEPKVIVKKEKNRIEVTVDHQVRKAQLNVVLAWLLIWTLCGGIIFTSLFFPFEREAKMMIIVWLVFWVYFELKAFRTYKWKKEGLETLIVENKEIILRQSGTDAEKKFNVKDVQMTVVPENKFRSAMSASFWSMGEPSIYFRAGRSNHGFGRQLSREEAIRIEKLIRPYLGTS